MSWCQKAMMIFKGMKAGLGVERKNVRQASTNLDSERKVLLKAGRGRS